MQEVAETGIIDDLMEDDSAAFNNTLRLLAETGSENMKEVAVTVLQDLPDYDPAHLKIDVALALTCITNCEELIAKFRAFNPQEYKAPIAAAMEKTGISEKII